MAMNQNLEIVPVINKIDLPHADDRSGPRGDRARGCSGRQRRRAGFGENRIWDRRYSGGGCRPHSAPAGNPDAPLRALIFDSHFDSYQGAVAYVRVIDGSVKPKDKIKMMATVPPSTWIRSVFSAPASKWVKNCKPARSASSRQA